jgi:hypothetical protein
MIGETTAYAVGAPGLINRLQANQEICIVLVDSLTGKNKIVWDKIYGQGIASYKLYKLVGSNYVFLAEQAFNDLTEYIDYSSDPMVVAARYKITTVDSLGNESAQSPYHQTINLSISEGVPNTTAVLQWNQYEDESGVFVPDWYYIYRGTTHSNMTVYDSVSAAFTSYNDVDAQFQHYYTISVQKIDACTPEGLSKLTSGPYSHSLSNIDDYGVATSIKQPKKLGIKIYPNTAHNQLTISAEQLTIKDIEICDITGKQTNVVCHSEQSEESVQINTANLKNGIYIIKIKTAEGSLAKLFVKE